VLSKQGVEASNSFWNLRREDLVYLSAVAVSAPPYKDVCSFYVQRQRSNDENIHQNLNSIVKSPFTFSTAHDKYTLTVSYGFG